MPVSVSISRQGLIDISALTLTQESIMDLHNPGLHVSGASGDRPRIAASGSVSFILSLLEKANCAVQERRYKPGDEIYLKESGSRSLAGPFFISRVTSEGKYTLCFENGEKARDGKEFAEKDLDKA